MVLLTRRGAALATVALASAPRLALAAQAVGASAPAIGAPAPDFALPDQDGRIRRLSELRGRVVVLE